MSHTINTLRQSFLDEDRYNRESLKKQTLSYINKKEE